MVREPLEHGAKLTKIQIAGIWISATRKNSNTDVVPCLTTSELVGLKNQYQIGEN